MTIEGLALADIVDASPYIVISILVITRKLVWHKDLKKAEDRADRWESIALESLGVAGKLTVQAEVTNEVLTRLPDPAKDEQS